LSPRVQSCGVVFVDAAASRLLTVPEHCLCLVLVNPHLVEIRLGISVQFPNFKLLGVIQVSVTSRISLSVTSRISLLGWY
jgi:hypothetical protein